MPNLHLGKDQKLYCFVHILQPISALKLRLWFYSTNKGKICFGDCKGMLESGNHNKGTN